MSKEHHPVVILYEYPLLGEGIATYLSAHLGVEATIASAGDLEAVTAALALGPAVVIFELSDRLRQLDLAALAPHADLIDVSTVVARGPVDSSGDAALDRILQSIRGCITVDEPANPLPALLGRWREVSGVMVEGRQHRVGLLRTTGSRLMCGRVLTARRPTCQTGIGAAESSGV